MKTVHSLTPAVPHPITSRRRFARLPHHPPTVWRPQRHIPRRIAIRGAYALLMLISIWTLVLDSYSRRNSEGAPLLAAHGAPAGTAPLPISPLAKSPFPGSRIPPAVASPVAVVAEANDTRGEGKRLFAPTGVFFLQVPVRVQTAAGGKSFDAGTQVRVVRHQAGKIRVSHHGTEFFVEKWEIRNEPDRTAS